MKDNIEHTPLHILCSLSKSPKSTGDAIRVCLRSTKKKKTAFVIDNAGKTPFTYLCEKKFDDLPFLTIKTCGDSMALWYDCMDISFFFTKNVYE